MDRGGMDGSTWKHNGPAKSWKFENTTTFTTKSSMKAFMSIALLIGRFASSSAFTTTTRSTLRVAPASSFISSGISSSSTNLSMAKKRVLVPIADDSEEIETTCITDTLTRFGAEVVVASVKPDGELVCRMSRGVKVR